MKTLVKEALPEFAAELRELLNWNCELELAAQIEALPLVDRCRCGQDSCATFYTAPKPDGAYGPGHSNVQLAPEVGMIILDLVDGKICCIEVLDRPDVQEGLTAILPSNTK